MNALNILEQSDEYPIFHSFASFVETKRYMDFRNPGSQAKDGSFFGLEASLEGLEPG